MYAIIVDGVGGSQGDVTLNIQPIECPAVDVGISVSRVGGSAQVKAMKKVAGTLKIDLAQFRSLQAFAMFASDLDAASRQQLTRGARLMELLKQPQYTPYPVEDQVASIWAGTKGKLDSVPLHEVRRFESEMLDHLRRHTDVLTTIASTGQLSDETEAALSAAIDEFATGFLAGEDTGFGTGAVEPGEAEADVAQEQIVKQKRG